MTRYFYFNDFNFIILFISRRLVHPFLFLSFLLLDSNAADIKRKESKAMSAALESRVRIEKEMGVALRKESLRPSSIPILSLGRIVISLSQCPSRPRDRMWDGQWWAGGLFSFHGPYFSPRSRHNNKMQKKKSATTRWKSK